MSKFNQANTNLTRNHEGHLAYKMTEKLKLVTMVLTSFYNESKFYGDNSKELFDLATSLAATDPKFVSNLAIYARKEFHLRSVAHVLTAVVANTNETKPFIGQTVAEVVERPDDILEIASAYKSFYGKSGSAGLTRVAMPNGLKKALGKSLKRFNEYQISKYSGGTKEFKFKDILSITHIKPDSAEQSELFKKILEDNLATAERWETEVSKNGNNKDSWTKVISDKHMGYMAMLRNLRNMLESGMDMTEVYKTLSDPVQVAKSKQLPFRYLSAYKEVSKVKGFTSKTSECLEDAIRASMQNVEKIPGKTVIAYDVSGSMSSLVSTNSTVTCAELSALLALMASHICDEVVAVYSFNGNLYQATCDKYTPILRTAVNEAKATGGTALELPLQYMLDNKIEADRLILISDNEINSGTGYYYGYRGYASTCQGLADKYRNKINSDFWVHAIDLQGYGTQQFQGGKTNIIAGWSEKVLGFINLAEQGFDTLVTKIENYR